MAVFSEWERGSLKYGGSCVTTVCCFSDHSYNLSESMLHDPSIIVSFKNILYFSILTFIHFLVTTCRMWDLSSLTRDRIHALYIGILCRILCRIIWNLNHWTTREAPTFYYSSIGPSHYSGMITLGYILEEITLFSIMRFSL